MNLHIHNNNSIPTWTNIDISKKFNPKRLPYNDSIFEYIYISDVLEYIERNDVVLFLCEVKRIIKPSGLIRISTLDFFRLHRLYPNKAPLQTLEKYLYGKKRVNGEEIINKMCYDFITIQKLLVMAGFYAVKRYDIFKTIHSNFKDSSFDLLANEEICLNVECYG